LSTLFLISFGGYLEASVHNDQLESVTSLEVFFSMKLFVAGRPFILSLTVSYSLCTTLRLTSWIFFSLETNGEYCSMQLNNDIVNVLNISTGAILALLTQWLLMSWRS